jgi:hypothetical protein
LFQSYSFSCPFIRAIYLQSITCFNLSNKLVYCQRYLFKILFSKCLDLSHSISFSLSLSLSSLSLSLSLRANFSLSLSLRANFSLSFLTLQEERCTLLRRRHIDPRSAAQSISRRKSLLLRCCNLRLFRPRFLLLHQQLRVRSERRWRARLIWRRVLPVRLPQRDCLGRCFKRALSRFKKRALPKHRRTSWPERDWQ